MPPVPCPKTAALLYPKRATTAISKLCSEGGSHCPLPQTNAASTVHLLCQILPRDRAHTRADCPAPHPTRPHSDGVAIPHRRQTQHFLFFSLSSQKRSGRKVGSAAGGSPRGARSRDIAAQEGCDSHLAR